MERIERARDMDESETPKGKQVMDENDDTSKKDKITNDQLDGLIFAFAKEKKNNEDCMNRLKYLQADFDNYRKRMDKQTNEAKRCTAESIYANLLEVLDELELALSNGRAANSSSALMEGVEMTLKKMKKMLASEGITEIACIGKTFDPRCHSAVSTMTRKDLDEGIVVGELRKGYLINERVLRPAMVKVSVKESESGKECNNKKG